MNLILDPGSPEARLMVRNSYGVHLYTPQNKCKTGNDHQCTFMWLIVLVYLMKGSSVGNLAIKRAFPV